MWIWKVGIAASHLTNSQFCDFTLFLAWIVAFSMQLHVTEPALPHHGSCLRRDSLQDGKGLTLGSLGDILSFWERVVRAFVLQDLYLRVSPVTRGQRVWCLHTCSRYSRAISTVLHLAFSSTTDWPRHFNTLLCLVEQVRQSILIPRVLIVGTEEWYDFGFWHDAQLLISSVSAKSTSADIVNVPVMAYFLRSNWLHCTSMPASLLTDRCA